MLLHMHAHCTVLWYIRGASRPVDTTSFFVKQHHGNQAVRTLSAGMLHVCVRFSATYLMLVCASAADSLAPPPPPPLTAPLQNEYRHTVIQLAFLVAVLYTAVGIFRLGFLIRFLRSVGR